MRVGEDRFTNIISASVTMSAANTQTDQQITTGVSLGSGMGLLIDHIDYYIAAGAFQEMTAAADQIDCYVSISSAPTLALTTRTLLDLVSLSRTDLGAAASGVLVQRPVERWYSPPIIIASPLLYLGMSSTGLASAQSLNARIYYRFIKLSDKEFLEIAETFAVLGS